MQVGTVACGHITPIGVNARTVKSVIVSFCTYSIWINNKDFNPRFSRFLTICCDKNLKEIGLIILSNSIAVSVRAVYWFGGDGINFYHTIIFIMYGAVF